MGERSDLQRMNRITFSISFPNTGESIPYRCERRVIFDRKWIGSRKGVVENDTALHYTAKCHIHNFTP